MVLLDLFRNHITNVILDFSQAKANKADLDLSTHSWIVNSTILKASKGAKIRNRCNQVPHLTQDTNGKVTNSQ